MAAFVTWLRAEWDRAAGVGFLLAGAVCLAVGYAGVAGASYVPQALSFIASGGFFGLLLVAVGATLLITAALHDEWRKLDRIEKAIDRLAQAGPPTLDLADAESGNGRMSRAVGGRPADAQRAVLASARPAGGGAAVLPGIGSRPALVAGIAGLIAATGLVGGGWTATASAVNDSTAYSTILLGIAGLALAGAVCAAWTLSLRRAARVRQARLLAPFSAIVARTAGGSAPAAHGPVAVADGLTRFHTPGCPALSGLSVRLIDRAEAVGSGLAGCRLCESQP